MAVPTTSTNALTEAEEIAKSNPEKAIEIYQGMLADDASTWTTLPAVSPPELTKAM